jgi:hypothetical protein
MEYQTKTKKSRFIERNTILSDDEKKQVISFFTQHPNYEKYIDWNKRNIGFEEFSKVIKIAENSNRRKRRKVKDSPLKMFEKYKCKVIGQTDEFAIVLPVDRESMVFFNSFQCGGEGAKWCIGDRKSAKAWRCYMSLRCLFYFIFFLKKNPFLGKKIMVGYDVQMDDLRVWLQEDREIDFGIVAYYLRRNYYICNEDPDDKQLFLNFSNVLIDNKKINDNYFLLQLVKKAYEYENMKDDVNIYY